MSVANTNDINIIISNINSDVNFNAHSIIDYVDCYIDGYLHNE